MVKLARCHSTTMQPKPDRPILQVGDFVKISFEGEQFIVSVKERIGNYVILSNGVKFHVLDDRWRSKEQWIHEPTGFLICLP